MFAYLMSQHNSGDALDKTSTGILLHPEIGRALDEMFVTPFHENFKLLAFGLRIK